MPNKKKYDRIVFYLSFLCPLKSIGVAMGNSYTHIFFVITQYINIRHAELRA